MNLRSCTAPLSSAESKPTGPKHCTLLFLQNLEEEKIDYSSKHIREISESDLASENENGAYLIISYACFGFITVHLSNSKSGDFCVKVNSHFVDRFRELKAEIEREEDNARRLFVRDIAQNNNFSLIEMLVVVKEQVAHVEAVNFYLDSQLCSYCEKSHTLLSVDATEGIFIDLQNSSAGNWSIAEQFLVSALYTLFVSGKAIRFEEFNGRSLTVSGIRTVFDRIAESHGVAPTGPHRDSYFLMAKAIYASISSQYNRDVLHFRVISGHDFNKKIQTIKLDREKFATYSGPESANVDHDEMRCYHDLLSSETPNDIHLEIRDIVVRVIQETRSSYGMCSTFYDFSFFSSEDVQTSINSLTPDDFRCVICADKTKVVPEIDLAERVFMPVQRRMQYNRWHFIAGNLENEKIVKGRHFFYPPSIPDIARDVDCEHAGHRDSLVKYSIRAPGPDIHDPPFEFGGIHLKGFYDLRVVRMFGDPFSIDDLIIVRKHRAKLESLITSSIRRGKKGDPCRIENSEAGKGLAF